MEEFISESLEIARQYFGRLGFDEDQIAILLASGERDLRKELAGLKELLTVPELDTERLNHSLHGIKGLLLNMGNSSAAQMFKELRADIQSREGIETLKKLLGIE